MIALFEGPFLAPLFIVSMVHPTPGPLFGTEWLINRPPSETIRDRAIWVNPNGIFGESLYYILQCGGRSLRLEPTFRCNSLFRGGPLIAGGRYRH